MVVMMVNVLVHVMVLVALDAGVGTSGGGVLLVTSGPGAVFAKLLVSGVEIRGELLF